LACSSISRHRCQPSTAGASISTICWKTWSPASRIHSWHQIRSAATSSGASRSASSSRWPTRAETPSTGVVEIDGARLFFPDERATELTAALRRHWADHP
jgi:hypothetical protein